MGEEQPTDPTKSTSEVRAGRLADRLARVFALSIVGLAVVGPILLTVHGHPWGGAVSALAGMIMMPALGFGPMRTFGEEMIGLAVGAVNGCTCLVSMVIAYAHAPWRAGH